MNDINKVYGMILGHSLGDALGAPSEFYKTMQPYTGKLEHKIIRRPMFQEKKYGVVGQVTDDSEMAFALMYTIKDGYSTDNAIKEYSEWASGPLSDLSLKSPFLGRNTKKLFLKSKGSNKLDFDKRYNNAMKKGLINNQSNGCLMRAYPLVCLPYKLIIEDTKLTNPSPICIYSVLIYIKAMRMSIKNVNKKEIIKEIRKYIKSLDKDVKQVISVAFEQAVKGEVRNVITKNQDDVPIRYKQFGKLNLPIYKKNVIFASGWVVHSLYCALYGLFNYTTYDKMIDSIIMLGGDTDTNGCIAGALFGAYYGILNMCKEPITKKNMRILVKADPNLGDLKRPEKYILNKNNLDIFVNVLEKNILMRKEKRYREKKEDEYNIAILCQNDEDKETDIILTDLAMKYIPKNSNELTIDIPSKKDAKVGIKGYFCSSYVNKLLKNKQFDIIIAGNCPYNIYYDLIETKRGFELVKLVKDMWICLNKHIKLNGYFMITQDHLSEEVIEYDDVKNYPSLIKYGKYKIDDKIPIWGTRQSFDPKIDNQLERYGFKIIKRGLFIENGSDGYVCKKIRNITS